MYIFGGRGDIHAPYHSQNEIYCPKIVYLDLDTLKWVEPDNVTGEVPTGRRSHSACEYMTLTFHFYILSTSIINYNNYAALLWNVSESMKMKSAHTKDFYSGKERLHYSADYTL